jgi:thioredoxin reductase
MKSQETKSTANVTRRSFISQGSILLAGLTFPQSMKALIDTDMHEQQEYDVIIIGGSYSGLAAAMALGRALKKVLIIDSGRPCNIQTPFSHNFITQDGKPPEEIASLAKQQVQKYKSVEFVNALVNDGRKVDSGFEIETDSGNHYKVKKLIFATGIKDLMPDIDGFSDCWGISVLHCPYCHGYEVRNQKTGVLGNGNSGFELVMMISNWTKELTLYTNGQSTLSNEQVQRLSKHNINIIETAIQKVEHSEGYVKSIVFKDGDKAPIKALYSKRPFIQHCSIPEKIGCELNDEGYIKTNPLQKTTVPGIYACGDNATRMRTVANAISMGTTAGMMLNKELIEETF